MIWPLLAWYVVVQLVTLAVLPVALAVGRGLPDRGQTLSKMLGILLVGVTLWLAVSYGLLRNERGGAWLTVLLVGAVSWGIAWRHVPTWWESLRRHGAWRHFLVSELVFAVAFGLWAVVRAYDPAANHTEQPMDLMFMNSIWASPTYPPQDAWLAGYAISYYYLGYWLLVTLGRLADVPPAIAYNVGQACWYGLLWLGAYGVVTNLLAARQKSTSDASDDGQTARIPGSAILAGVLGGVSVALTGNMQVLFEWLHAQGGKIEGLARWIGVYGFPERASQTGQWYIGFDWWWWRSSRVIEDLDLAGNHIEVIDEFPIFSYLLGDNHPHVIAMPVALLVIGMALSFYLQAVTAREDQPGTPRAGWPGWLGGAVALVGTGSLVFLNTWDFPPYLALMAAVAGIAGVRGTGQWFAWRWAAVVGLALGVGTVLLYLPYFLTAQNQAGGVIPNLFNPTRVTQFLVMFGGFVPALVALLAFAWREAGPSMRSVLLWGGCVIGGAVVILAAAGLMATATVGGRGLLARMALPEGMTYGGAMLSRWLQQPWTLLLTGSAAGITGACLIALLKGKPGSDAGRSGLGDGSQIVLPFVLLLAGLGLALVFVPEVVFLRDNFGTRMNTIFKFYYQAWFLLGLVTAYCIGMAFTERSGRWSIPMRGAAALSLLLVLAGVLFPVAGVYAKTGGFRAERPTLDAAAYVASESPDTAAAVAWIKRHTAPGALVLEGKGASYRADTARISTLTGRPTLLGWDGHQSQWRGDAYGAMARGRPEALDVIYRSGTPSQVAEALAQWKVDFVVIGPAEVAQYGISEVRLGQLREVLEPVFVSGQVVILRPQSAGR